VHPEGDTFLGLQANLNRNDKKGVTEIDKAIALRFNDSQHNKGSHAFTS